MTKTQATTTYPEGGSTQSTEKFQYDQRGRVTTEQLKFNLPTSWNVTNALPTYQMAFLYNDANQLTTSTSSTINGQGQSTPGYSTFQNYDTNTGVSIGLSTQTSSAPTLASLAYNSAGLVNTLTFQNGVGTEQAAEQFSYDGDLRPSEDTATWQSGSGQSGQNPHHLIPCSLQNHALVTATEGQFDMNGEYNGRALGDYNHRTEALNEMEPYHANAPRYATHVRSMMDDAYQRLANSGTLNSDTAYNSLMGIINQLNNWIDVIGWVGSLLGEACPLY